MLEEESDGSWIFLDGCKFSVTLVHLLSRRFSNWPVGYVSPTWILRLQHEHTRFG